MAEAEDRLDFCRQALGELGTRSTITSLDPPDGSQEAYYCNLLFESTRDQILRAAHWGFAGRSDAGILWKAQPGTPENPGTRRTWSVRDPQPRWLYSYRMFLLGAPFDAVKQIRRVRGQEPLTGADDVPLYSGIAAFAGNSQRGGCVEFEVATDQYDRAGNLIAVTKGIEVVVTVSAGSGYQAGDLITLTQAGTILYGQPTTLLIRSVGPSGEVLDTTPADVGTWVVEAPGPVFQLTTTGTGAGFSGTPTFTDNLPVAKVFLTNVRNPVVDYTTSHVGVLEYDALFGDAFMLAFEGKLALALLGDRALYAAKLQEANASIINARVRDGNEGLTTYDFVPDWMQARGIASGTALNGWLPQYGPLFSA
jgi:hypothetical protein